MSNNSKFTEVTLTLASFSTKGDFIKLGETPDPAAAQWFKLNPKSEAFVNKNYKKGERVTISYTKVGKDNVIGFIKKADGQPIGNTRVPRKTAGPQVETGATPNRIHTGDFQGGVSPYQLTIQKSITQQTALNCATAAVKVLEGQITSPKELGVAILEVYEKIYPAIEFKYENPAVASVADSAPQEVSGPQEITTDDGPQEA